MVPAALVTDLLGSPPTAMDLTAEIVMLRLALEAERERNQELEAERAGWVEERAGLVRQLERVVAERDQLRSQMDELSRRAGLNSMNSSKPPSSDGLRRRPRPSSPERKRRQEQGRRPGKQKGSAGVHLEPVADPDQVEELLPSHCGRCQSSLAGVLPGLEDAERRQVWDVPPPRVLIRTEYRSLALMCPECGETTKAAFPEWAKAPVSYGPGLHAAAAYLHVWHYLSFKRTAQALHDLLGAEVSTGTVAAMVSRGGERVGPALAEIEGQLQAAEVVHLDETGSHVNGKLWWVHGAATDKLTLLGIDRRRGGEGMGALGVAGELAGVAVHDHWSSYWGESLPKVSGHALCNAHHLRELTEVHELYGQRWAGRMSGLLQEGLGARNLAMERGRSRLQAGLLAEFERRYGNIVKEGWKANPRRPGRAQRSRPGNLVRRLDERRSEVLRFLHDFRVPFTNNEIERDLRMVKLHEKVSGGWRSEAGAQAFLNLRSYLATARKQGQGMLETLAMAFEGRPWKPAAAGP